MTLIIPIGGDQLTRVRFDVENPKEWDHTQHNKDRIASTSNYGTVSH